MPRPKNTDLRKQQIVEAMVSVMGNCGYDGATIPAIAREAKLASGLVLYHFPNKQAILLALLEYLTAVVNRRFEARRTTDASKNLQAYIDAHLAYGEDAAPSAVSCWLALSAQAVHQEDVRMALQSVTESKIQFLEELCESALQAENRITTQKHELALGVYAAIEGAFHLVVIAPKMIAPGFAAPTVSAMARGLISAQPPVNSTKGRT